MSQISTADILTIKVDLRVCIQDSGSARSSAVRPGMRLLKKIEEIVVRLDIARAVVLSLVATWVEKVWNRLKPFVEARFKPACSRSGPPRVGWTGHVMAFSDSYKVKRFESEAGPDHF